MKNYRAQATNRDLVRSVANLVFSTGILAATGLGYITGTNSNFSEGSYTDPAIIPAGYAFSIWGIIYSLFLGYGIYGMLPQQRTNPLLRRTGWFSASAYLATISWLLAAQSRVTWLTVVCMFWILISLLGTFREIVRYTGTFTTAERFLVKYQIALFLGWISVATVANTGAALSEYGIITTPEADQAMSIGLLLAAACFASLITLKSRGSIGYVMAVIWGLGGVVAANLGRDGYPIVAITAGVSALTVAAALVRARFSNGSDTTNKQGQAAQPAA